MVLRLRSDGIFHLLFDVRHVLVDGQDMHIPEFYSDELIEMLKNREQAAAVSLSPRIEIGFEANRSSRRVAGLLKRLKVSIQQVTEMGINIAGGDGVVEVHEEAGILHFMPSEPLVPLTRYLLIVSTPGTSRIQSSIKCRFITGEV